MYGIYYPMCGLVTDIHEECVWVCSIILVDIWKVNLLHTVILIRVFV